MKIVVSFLVGILLIAVTAQGQKTFATRNGKVSFIAPNDADVKAVNNEVTSRVSDNGQVSFSVLIKGFQFSYAEMQAHFNDQYLESSKFPRADFKGMIINLKEVNFTKDGVYSITVKGDMQMHGVIKPMTVTGKMAITSSKPTITGQFTLLMKDFKVEAAVVATRVTATLNCQYQ